MYQNRQDNDFSRHIPPPIGETFDPVAWEPGRQPGPSPNPSVTPITESPCSTRVITVSSSASSSLSPFSLFPFRKRASRIAAHPSRGRIDEGRHVHVPIAHAGYRIRRARLPCFTGVLLRGASRGCSRLQVHLALPLRSERRGDERFGGVHCDRVI